MTVTYASFQQNLNISGTSTITKKPGAASTIKDMVSTKPNELYIDNNGDVRYYGENPNNYVTFNNELWRIIGVLNNKVKIVIINRYIIAIMPQILKPSKFLAIMILPV